MRSLIIIFIVLTSSLFADQTKDFKETKQAIYENLKQKITGKDRDIMRIAELHTKLLWILEIKPSIIITPQIIKVDGYGKVDLSKSRQLKISWKSPIDDKANILEINADLIPNLIKKSNKPTIKLSLLTGLILSNNVKQHLILSLAINIIKLWRFSLIFGAGYPGVSVGISYELNHIWNLNTGVILSYENWALNPSLGITARIF